MDADPLKRWQVLKLRWLRRLPGNREKKLSGSCRGETSSCNWVNLNSANTVISCPGNWPKKRGQFIY